VNDLCGVLQDHGKLEAAIQLYEDALALQACIVAAWRCEPFSRRRLT
jgi:hypothetical protein